MNRFSVLTGVPEFTKGLVRELRIRWALEELGLTYEEIRYPHPETKKDAYKTKQPFGQVPYFTSGDVCMFETGAILLHLALKHKELLPESEVERAQALTWLFAPLNSIEPFVFHYFMLKSDPDASEATKARALETASQRLRSVSECLGEKAYFGSGFSIAEIVMTTVLKTTKQLGLIDGYANLCAYVERNEARPAFQRALKDHVKLYVVNA